MTTTTIEDQLLTDCEKDPVVFYEDFLGCHTTFEKQKELIRSVVVNRRTAVLGANSTGKDYATGRLILYWLNTRYPSKVILTGPTYRQVADVVWRETRTGYRNRIGDLKGHMYDKDPRYELGDEWFALGFSTDDPNYMQGFHSPHLLVIVTEAHGMNQDIMDAVKRLNPERLVLTGNPLGMSGEFYDAFHGTQSLYNTITISAFDTPNLQQGRVVIPGMVTKEDVEERKAEYGEDSPMYRASVLGLWTSREGLVYSSFNDQMCRIPRFEIPDNWLIYVGHDFGSANPAAMFYAQNPGTSDFFAWHEYLPGAGRSIFQHVQEFKRITEGRNVLKRAGGSHQEDEIRQGYTAQGWPISEPMMAHSVQQGIQRVFDLHSLNKIYVFNDLTNYLREKLYYAYKKQDGIWLDIIENKNRFHLMDAERSILPDFKPVMAGDASKTEIHKLGVRT